MPLPRMSLVPQKCPVPRQRGIAATTIQTWWSASKCLRFFKKYIADCDSKALR